MSTRTDHLELLLPDSTLIIMRNLLVVTALRLLLPFLPEVTVRAFLYSRPRLLHGPHTSLPRVVHQLGDCLCRLCPALTSQAMSTLTPLRTTALILPLPAFTNLLLVQAALSALPARSTLTPVASLTLSWNGDVAPGTPERMLSMCNGQQLAV